MNKKVSVLMAVYNEEKYISESIKSILNQTFKDFEFIIVNDGSNDRTLQILNRYKHKDKRIKIISNKNKLGVAEALNIGLKQCNGEYIARMDGDDISLKFRLERQVEYLENNSEIFIVGGGAIYLKNNKNSGFEIPPTDNILIKEALIHKNILMHPTIMFRNSKEVKYRSKFVYAQDYDLYLRLLNKNKRFANIDKILIFYRVSSNNMNPIKRIKQEIYAKKAKEFFFERKIKKRDKYSLLSKESIEKESQKEKKKLILYSIEESIESMNTEKLKEKAIELGRKYYLPIRYKILCFMPQYLIKILLHGNRFIKNKINNAIVKIRGLKVK